jgi:hypothetical protein
MNFKILPSKILIHLLTKWSQKRINKYNIVRLLVISEEYPRKAEYLKTAVAVRTVIKTSTT